MSRVLLCKSLLPTPSLFSAPLTSLKPTSSPFTSTTTSRIHRMATEASPSPSSNTGGDTNNPPAPSSSSPSLPASSAIDFLSLCHRLKTTKRAGWVKRDVKDPESIADHMYRMGLMALIASDIPGVNRDKCIKIAIVHDIAEAKELGELWLEYEGNSSPEAKIVKDLDKVEMILQALEYENDQGKDLEEFFSSTAGKFQTDVGKAWAAEIASRRKKQG